MMKEIYAIARIYARDTHPLWNLTLSGWLSIAVSFLFFSATIISTFYLEFKLQPFYGFLLDLAMALILEAVALIAVAYAYAISMNKTEQKIKKKLVYCIKHWSQDSTQLHVEYLKKLIEPISDSLSDALREIRDLRKEYLAYTPLVHQDKLGFAVFEREAKPRILALLVLCLSLASLIIVLKLASDELIRAKFVSMVDWVGSNDFYVVLIQFLSGSVVVWIVLGMFIAVTQALFQVLAIRFAFNDEVDLNYLISKLSYYVYYSGDHKYEKLPPVERLAHCIRNLKRCVKKSVVAAGRWASRLKVEKSSNGGSLLSWFKKR